MCVLGLCLTPQDDVQNDGGTEDGGDGIEGNDGGGRKGTEEVAEEGKEGTCEHGGGKEDAVVGRAKEEEGYMRGGKSEKSDRTTIGGNDRSEDASGKEKEVACALDVDAQVDSVVLP